jgi:glycosyltransferase involved in cell wall biosynthesis
MKICFVSYEIHPTSWGGCGVLLHNTAHILLQQGHTVIFLLYLSEKAFIRFRDVDRLALPFPERCSAYHVGELCADLPLTQTDFNNDFMWRAYRFHYAAQKVAAIEKPDLIEFFDYCGVAYYALGAKITQQAYSEQLLIIRLHNSLELMDLHEPTKTHDFERYLAFALEHSALRKAEVVLYPSKNYLHKSYLPHYEPWLGKQVWSKPALVNFPQSNGKTENVNMVLFYGRLFGFKGVDLFVDAAVSILYANPTLDL